MSTIVEVAAAVMLRADGPGVPARPAAGRQGSPATGSFRAASSKRKETVRQALIRELAGRAGHHRHRLLAVADPRVPSARHGALNFWRVTAWRGEIGITVPLEHSAFGLAAHRPASHRRPILPANDPILKALSLPTVMAITNAGPKAPNASSNAWKKPWRTVCA